MGGENILLTHIVLGPRQDPIVFEDRDDVRSIGEMITNPSPHGGKAAKKTGQRLGWTSLHTNAFVLYRARFAPPDAAASNGARKKLLLLGKIIPNSRDTHSVVLQPYRGKWVNSKVLYVPLFQSRYGHTEEQGEPVLESVRYSDLVHTAELKRNGELSLGTEAALRRGP